MILLRMRPVVKIYDQSSFERSDLNGEFKFAISIQNKGSYPAVLRPDFRGRRLNLYFDDVVEGPGAATPADIEALFSFGVEWLAEVRKHPSSTVVHCGAGISRSAASALLLLVFISRIISQRPLICFASLHTSLRTFGYAG